MSAERIWRRLRDRLSQSAVCFAGPLDGMRLPCGAPFNDYGAYQFSDGRWTEFPMTITPPPWMHSYTFDRKRWVFTYHAAAFRVTHETTGEWEP